MACLESTLSPAEPPPGSPRRPPALNTASAGANTGSVPGRRISRVAPSPSASVLSVAPTTRSKSRGIVHVARTLWSSSVHETMNTSRVSRPAAARAAAGRGIPPNSAIITVGTEENEPPPPPPPSPVPLPPPPLPSPPPFAPSPAAVATAPALAAEDATGPTEAGDGSGSDASSK